MALRGLAESQEGACPDKYKRNGHVAIAPEPGEPSASGAERAELPRQPPPPPATSSAPYLDVSPESLGPICHPAGISTANTSPER